MLLARFLHRVGLLFLNAIHTGCKFSFVLPNRDIIIHNDSTQSGKGALGDIGTVSGVRLMALVSEKTKTASVRYVNSWSDSYFVATVKRLKYIAHFSGAW